MEVVLAAALAPSSSTIVRRLRGELDRVTMKALRKEPEQRYESASALLDDLRRYAEQPPILPRPDSAG